MRSAPPPSSAATACWSARRAPPPPPSALPTSRPSTPGWSGSPMADLALWPIGNCQVSALVDGAAGFVWACAPRVDGDPLFCALLEPEGAAEPPRGAWRIALEGQVAAE